MSEVRNTLVEEQMAFVFSVFDALSKDIFLVGKNLKELLSEHKSIKVAKKHIGNDGNTYMFEVKGMTSEQMNLFFRCCQIQPSGCRQVEDGSFLLGINTDDLNRAYNLATRLNKGEISFEDLMEQEGIEREEFQRDTENKKEMEEMEEQASNPSVFEDEILDDNDEWERDTQDIVDDVTVKEDNFPPKKECHNYSQPPRNNLQGEYEEDSLLIQTERAHSTEEEIQTENAWENERQDSLDLDDGEYISKEKKGFVQKAEENPDEVYGTSLECREQVSEETVNSNEKTRYALENKPFEVKQEEIGSNKQNSNTSENLNHASDVAYEQLPEKSILYNLEQDKKAEKPERAERVNGVNLETPIKLQKINEAHSDIPIEAPSILSSVDIPLESYTTDIHKSIYQQEKEKQKEIQIRQEMNRISHETATVIKVGSGKDITYENMSRPPEQKLQKNCSEQFRITTERTESGASISSNSLHIEINKINLINEHARSRTDNSIEKLGETFLKPLEGRRDANAYRGYKTSAGVVDTISFPLQAAVLYASANNNFNLSCERLSRRQENGAYKTLNEFLKEKRVLGVFEDGPLKYGLDFSTRENTIRSQTALLNYLEKKGLVQFRGNKWDVTRMQKLLERGDIVAMARILKLSSNTGEMPRRQIIKAMQDIIRNVDAPKLMSSHNMKKTGKLLSKGSRKLCQDTAVFQGLTQNRKVVSMVRKGLKGGWVVAAFVTKPVRKAGAWVGKKAGTAILKRNEYGRKILNKQTKLQVLRQNQLRARKAKIDYKKKKHDIRIETKFRRKQFRKQKRKDKIEKTMKLTMGSKMGGVVFRRANKILGKAGMAAKVFSVGFGSIFKLVGFGRKIKIAIMIGAGGLLLLLILIGGMASMGAAVVSTVTSFFEFNEDVDTSVAGVYESNAGFVVNALVGAETAWVNGLKNIGSNKNLDLNSLYYGPERETFSSYAQSHLGTTVEGRNIKGPNPFGSAANVPDVAYKKISSIDEDGVELIYVNASGGTTRTSNIKEILAMCAVYFENETDLSDYEEDAQTQKDSDESNSSFWSDLKTGICNIGNGISSFFEWCTSPYTNQIEKMESRIIMTQYCITLFNASHQEQFDIHMEIKNTRKQLDESGITDITDISVCDDYRKYLDTPSESHFGYGCMEYDGFYYHNGRICINGTTDVSAYVMPQSMAERGSTADDCSYTATNEAFYSVYNHNPNCWEIEGNVKEHTKEGEMVPGSKYLLSTEDSETETEDTVQPSARGVATIPDEKVPKSNAEEQQFIMLLKRICSSNNWYIDIDSLKIEKQENGSFKVYLGSKVTKTVQENREDGTYGWKVYVDTIMEYEVIFTHKCQGNHIGYYCGGHLLMDVTGKVYGFTDEQLGAQDEDDAGEYMPKVEDGKYIHVDTNKLIIDKNALLDMQDVFDADCAIRRPVEAAGWEGWTQDNMDMAIIKYKQDWEDLYDITIASALGGKALKEADIISYMENIKMYYPDLSQERLDIIYEAMHKVGNIGYDQRHHNCSFEGPCLLNKKGACGMSDCSGFCSNLWREAFGRQIYSTSTFWSTFKGTSRWSKYSLSTIQPGDILLHYGGGGPGGGDDHALLYVGMIYPDSTEEYVIDCSTVLGVGNVFLRVRNYYDECYVVSPR